MPVLAQQAHMFLLIHCNDSGAAWMPDDFEFYGYAIGHGYGFDAQLDNPALVHGLMVIGHVHTPLEYSC